MNSTDGNTTVDYSARHELIILEAFFSTWLFYALRVAFIEKNSSYSL